MDISVPLSWLLGSAVLLPLASFVLILLGGPYMGKGGKQAGVCATGAILISCILSLISLFIWVNEHPIKTHDDHHAVAHDEHAHDGGHGEDHDHDGHDADESHEDDHDADESHEKDTDTHDVALLASGGDDPHGHGHSEPPPAYHREVYTLGNFGDGYKMSISVYIDTLTVCMFCMVTLIATCIHFYATGYMHDELEGDDYVDHEVTMSDGSHLHRPGRYHRFFQALSLFCFSMLGLVLSGNIAMTFVFWELVGICSYFLIGFYVERHSASTAANKAFIVNRVGDFGMIIGLMALWGALGTFSFGGEDGIFAQVRSPQNDYRLETPDGMVRAAASAEVAALVRELGPDATQQQVEKQ